MFGLEIQLNTSRYCCLEPCTRPDPRARVRARARARATARPGLSNGTSSDWLYHDFCTASGHWERVPIMGGLAANTGK